MTAIAPTTSTPSRREPVSVIKAVAVIVAGIGLGLFIATGALLILLTQFFNYHLVTIQSGSMEPALSKGDIVLTRPASMASVDEGDIILFNEANTGIPFVHRVGAIQQFRQDLRDGQTGELLETHSRYQFQTKGDANASADGGVVIDDNYRGRVMITLPTGTWFGDGTSISTLMTFLAIGMALLWVTWEVISRIVRRTRRGNTVGTLPPASEPLE